MKYLKSFLESQGKYSQTANNQKSLQAVPSIGGFIGKKPKIEGELVDDEEDITIPINVDITGHIGTPTKSTRMSKIAKEPKVRNC